MGTPLKYCQRMIALGSLGIQDRVMLPLVNALDLLTTRVLLSEVTEGTKIINNIKVISYLSYTDLILMKC